MGLQGQINSNEEKRTGQHREKKRSIVTSELGVVSNSSVNRGRHYLGIFNFITLSFTEQFFTEQSLIKTDLIFA